MDNGGDAGLGTVAVREEDQHHPSSYADTEAAAEVMATPRSEIADLGPADISTPVTRPEEDGGAAGAASFLKDSYGGGDEPDVFEEAVQGVAEAVVDGDGQGGGGGTDAGGYGDGNGQQHLHDLSLPPAPPPVSTGGDAPDEGLFYGTSPATQVGGQQQASETGRLPGGGFEGSDAAPNSGEVIGGYDEGPGPDDTTAQHPGADDDVSLSADNGAAVDNRVASVPAGAPEVLQYHNDRDMQIGDTDGIHQNGDHEPDDNAEQTPHDQALDNGLNNGDEQPVLLPPEPTGSLEKELPLQDPYVESETGGDKQATMPNDQYPLDAASNAVQDVAEVGSRGLLQPDTAPNRATTENKDDGCKAAVEQDSPQLTGGTTNLKSLDNGDTSPDAADRRRPHDVWSDAVQSQGGDQDQDMLRTPETADVLSQLSESPPPQSDTPTVETYNEGIIDDDDDGEDEVQSSPLQSPPPPATIPPAVEQKPSSASQSHPSGLGSSAPLPEPAATSRALQQQQQQQQQSRVNGSVSHRQTQLSEDGANGEVEEYDETREKLQMIRVKFLRLAHRLGQTPHNVVVAQVLYRLGLAEQLRGSMNTSRAGAFSFDRASAMAEQLEAAGQDPLDFSCTVMVIGKTGVGKSATINSIFDEVRLKTDAFKQGTQKVQEIVGTVQGIKVRVIDTPGLLPSLMDQVKNDKILQSVKKFIKKTPPDVIMYLDRLDMQNRDMGDVPLLRTITNVFGPSIWFNAIVVLTHAASAPPEGANGSPLSYEMYVTQRTHVIQNAIRQAAGDPRLLNPVSLVENHSACRMNRAGQRVLPNGQVWKPHLLLLSFASKILTEANMLLKLQDVPTGRPSRQRSPPLPFFLSSLLQSRSQVKLPYEQFGEDDPVDMDVDEESGSDEDSDYDELPPFKRLTKEQLSQLSKTQRKAYFEELDYREKLFYKKQLKEERKRRKILKKMAAEAKNISDEYNNDGMEEDENNAPATVPVPMNDMTLPASFDSDYPSHRYRFLDSTSQWIVRPVLETQGWDHDIGYEGVNVERLFVVRDKVPLSVSGQLTKDKKECTLQMEMASSLKHGEGKATTLGLDLQSIGKDMAYTVRGETRFSNFRRNTTAAGLSATLLGETLSAGVKIEDKLTLGKRFKMLISGGAMSGRGDVAYGGRLEATLRDKDYPFGRQLSTLALSVVDWHGDLAIGCNLQSQIPVGRSTNMTAHASLNNRGTGQIGVRVNSSEQILLAMAALAPLLSNARKYIFGSSEFDH